MKYPGSFLPRANGLPRTFPSQRSPALHKKGDWTPTSSWLVDRKTHFEGSSPLFCARQRSAGFTLVELLVVIAIISILVALLLPAVQAAREAARRASCANNLVQMIVAVNQYEMAHGVYPPGTVDAQGPIRSIAKGYHHSWVTQILPYMEQRAAFAHIDRSVGVYDPKNAPVRSIALQNLACPSSPRITAGYSHYAGLHHDVEAPIDANNNGIFFLNSHVGYEDVSDGTSQTIFLGEKLMPSGDLGWMSGTSATLRNTGTTIWSGRMAGTTTTGPTGPPTANAPGEDPGGAEPAASQNAPPVESQVLNGIPQGPLAVGGFGSFHPNGANFALGDGSIRYLPMTINMQVYQQLGHRADGKLLSEDSY